MELNDFITRHGRATFRHSAELFAAIRSGACVLDHAANGTQSLPCSHLVHIYRRRADHLRQFSSPHAACVTADVLALLAELERSPEEPCGLWGFSLSPHFKFSIFEGLTSQRILGCIRGVDDRLIDGPIRKKLWHDATGNA